MAMWCPQCYWVLAAIQYFSWNVKQASIQPQIYINGKSYFFLASCSLSSFISSALFLFHVYKKHILTFLSQLTSFIYFVTDFERRSSNTATPELNAFHEDHLTSWSPYKELNRWILCRKPGFYREGKTRPQEALKKGRSYSWLASSVGLALLKHLIFYNSCKMSLYSWHF